MELARGTVGDRPWGATLFGLGKRAVNGQLVVTGGEHRCCIAWRDGALVGATTSFAADSVTRIAVTGHLVSSSQLDEITRQLGANPGLDEIDVVTTAANLTPPHADKLRRRVIEQRAARTFAIDDGEFVVHDQISIPVAALCEVDVRAVIYLGAHLQLSEQRLAIELRQLGSHFMLEPDAFEHLHRFGFTEIETPILQALRAGTSVPELATVRELDPRVACAVIYALATCDSVTRIAVPRVPTPPAIDHVPVELSPRTLTPRRAPAAPSVARTPTPNVGRTPTPPQSGIAIARVPTVRPSSPRIEYIDIDPAIARPAASPRPSTEPAVARTPSRPAVGRVASRPAIARTPTPNVSRTVTATERETSPQGDDRELAAAAYKRGQRALRAEELDQAIVELARACELAPSNVDYQALCGWARFCIAGDKEAIVAETRKVLEKAISKSVTPLVARFYLGRVERMVGREREALRHFHEVIEADPGHAAAASEIRVLEARLAANAKR